MQYTFGGCKVPGVVCRGVIIAPMLLPEVSLKVSSIRDWHPVGPLFSNNIKDDFRRDVLEGVIMFQDPHYIIVGFAAMAGFPRPIHGLDATSSLNKVFGWGLRDAETWKIPQDYRLHDFPTTLLHWVADTDETAQKLHSPSIHYPSFDLNAHSPGCHGVYLPEIAPRRKPNPTS